LTENPLLLRLGSSKVNSSDFTYLSACFDKSILISSALNQEPETKDDANIVKQEQANNQSEKSSIPRDITHNITAEGRLTSEGNREISDDVRTDERKTLKSCSRENLDNKNASEIRVEKASEAKQSTYAEILDSETQGNYLH